MADAFLPKKKPLTKEDIKRLRESLPKKVEISSEGTKITEQNEDVTDVAPVLESHSDEISVPLSAEEIHAFQIYASMLKEKIKDGTLLDFYK